VLGISDRVLVVHEGRVIKELVTKDTTEEEIMMYATGQADSAAMVC
jgi:ABC-type sugar transport system ATPase subunit